MSKKKNYKYEVNEKTNPLSNKHLPKNTKTLTVPIHLSIKKHTMDTNNYANHLEHFFTPYARRVLMNAYLSLVESTSSSFVTGTSRDHDCFVINHHWGSRTALLPSIGLILETVNLLLYMRVTDVFYF